MIKSGRAGFSLVELLVALFLAGLILTLGVRLLQEVQIVLLDWQRMAPEPVARLSEALIRADVQAARGILRGTKDTVEDNWVWSTAPLRLAVTEGREIQYDSELGELVRSVRAPIESESGRRTVLRRVSSWRWRRLPGGVIEIGLVYSRPRDPGSRVKGSRAQLRNSETRIERLFLRYAMRGRPGRGSW
jgi:prepilin-type N-terminal cleavage/methylation domain-containing protein